jgi:hypothetical protein
MLASPQDNEDIDENQEEDDDEKLPEVSSFSSVCCQDLIRAWVFHSFRLVLLIQRSSTHTPQVPQVVPKK